MEKYIKVYHWDVLEMIKKGMTVYMLDRELAEIFVFNEISMCKGLEILNTKDDNGRYDFWRIEVVENAEL